MIQVHVTYQFESGIPYAAASVNAPVEKLDDALEGQVKAAIEEFKGLFKS